METIKLDLIPGKKMPSLHASQFDDGRAYHIDLTENNVPYKLDGTEVLTVNERKGDNNICSLDIENIFADKTYVEFASTLQMCAVAGANICELVIKRGSVTLGTLNFILEIEPCPTEGGIESESEISNLERQITEITEQVVGDDYYNKTQTDEKFATNRDLSEVITIVDRELDRKADKSNTYTITQTNEAIATAIEGKADKETTYTKTEVDNALNNKMDKANPTGTGKIAVGSNVVASGGSSQAFGASSTASGAVSHAEGINTTASGMFSHAEGQNTTASGAISHAEGNYTVANHKSQHVFGEYNIPDDSEKESDRRGNYVEIVGNGARSSERSNARTLDWSGNETLAGDLTYNGNKSITSEISRLDGRIDNLPAPMIFKGTLGVGGTIQTLPAASTSNEGWTYKVITDGTYAGQTAKAGDVFTSNGSAWVLIPSGDTDTDTWRAIKVNGVEKLGNGISSGSLDVVDTDNIEAEFDNDGNKLKIKTKNIYTQSEVDTLIANAVDSVLPTDSVSKSAVATFETDYAKPIEFKAYIEAVQASGTPTPTTPLPISGISSVKVFQRGENLWNGEWEQGTFDQTTGEKTSSTSLKRNVTPIAVKPNTSYARVKTQEGTLLACRMFYYDKNMSLISTAVDTSNILTITTPSDCVYVNFAFQNNITALSFNYPSSDTEIHAYNPNSQDVTIALGGTYYGGYVTQDKAGHRQLVVTCSELLDMGDLTWANLAAGDNIFRAVVPNCKFPTDNADRKNGFLCTIYPASSTVSISANMTDKSLLRYSGWIVLRDTSYSDYTELANGLSGAKLIYELAEPIVIDLPDGEPITALNGVNNVFCDSGDTEVTYKLSINKALSNLGGGNRSVSLAKSVEEEVKEEPKDEPETRQER